MRQINISHPLILAVDDNSDNLLLLSLALELFGFSCLCLNRAKYAVDLARYFQPQLILLDIVMADISGIDVAKFLKVEPQTAEIPLVGMTAMVTHQYPRCWPIHIFDDFLTKPYLLDDLEHTISRHLGNKQKSTAYAV